MNPRSHKVQEGVLSLLAGDVFRDTPLTIRLFMFKALYYLANLSHPVRASFAWKKRRLAVQETAMQAARASDV